MVESIHNEWNGVMIPIMIYETCRVQGEGLSDTSSIECIVGVLPSADDIGRTSDLAVCMRGGGLPDYFVQILDKDSKEYQPDDMLIELVSDHFYPDCLDLSSVIGFGITAKANSALLRLLSKAFASTSVLLDKFADIIESTEVGGSSANG